MVQIDNRVTSPVSEAADERGSKRFIAARVPNFSTVASMLARTDLLARLPAIVMEGSLEPSGQWRRRDPQRQSLIPVSGGADSLTFKHQRSIVPAP